MLNKFYLALFLCFVAHEAHAQNSNIQVSAAVNATESVEPLKFCDDVVQVIETMIANRLPLAAKAEAADLLNETKNGVAFCKQDFVGNASQYHICCSETLRLSTNAINIMAANYWSNAGSGAGRLSLFW